MDKSYKPTGLPETRKDNELRCAPTGAENFVSNSISRETNETIKRLQSQLTAETIRAGEYQQERDRLRDAISRVEDWMHDDRAGMSALAAIIQDATGEAAIDEAQPFDNDAQVKIAKAFKYARVLCSAVKRNKPKWADPMAVDVVLGLIEDAESCLTVGKAEGQQ